jgi:RNA-directed DNA polymerase
MRKDSFKIKRLNIAHESSLARGLGYRTDDLHLLAETARDFYKPFELHPKPRPFAKKPPKKARPIDNPTGTLKQAQERINKILLSPVILPDHIFGAVRYRSILGNAQCHQGAKLLVTLDVRQCFPSITNVHIYSVWANILGCSPAVASLLTKLTTFNRHLPQGASTSPVLANLFIWSVDAQIRDTCTELGVEYSTWIDDLAFSGDKARDMIQVAVEALHQSGLRLSHKKIRIMGASQSKTLTGTRFGNRIIRAPKEICDRARAGIHKLECNLISETDKERYCRGLSALIAHIQRICPKDAVRLRENLSAQMGQC